MENISPTQRLAHDRQCRRADEARHHRQAQKLPVARRAPIRTGAGWMLVRAGLRLACIDPFSPAPAGTFPG